MAADVVGRGAVWAAFMLLYKAVKETQEKDVAFKRSLEKIDRTLEALKPLLEDIDELNEKVVADLPPDQILDFKSEMEKGAELLTECSKSMDVPHGCNLFKKTTDYREKLQELDESLHRFIRMLEVQGMRDAKETSVMLQEIYDAVMNKQSNLGNTSKTPSSGPPGHQFQSPVSGLDDYTLQKQTRSVTEGSVAGGGVGQAFSILFELAKDIKTKNMEYFKPTLEKINATLQALKPLVEDIEQSKEKLDLPESKISAFKTEMEKGAELIRLCSEVHGYNIFKKTSSKDKLEELNETLRTFIQIPQVR